MKKILYIGWIGYGNLGDELMFNLFKEQILLLGDEYKLDFVNCEKRYLDNISSNAYDLIVLGGGSILNSSHFTISPIIIDFLHDALLLNKKIMIWGTGLDWFSKPTIPILENKDKPSIYISNKLRMKTKTVFTSSEWTGVRGPLTLELFNQFGITENIQISGDPAFLLDYGQKVETRPNQDQKIIGVNWGTTFNYVYGENEQHVEEQLAKALHEFIQQGYKIYFYIVWKGDIEVTKRLYDRVNDKERVVLDTTLYDHKELINVMKDFYSTINFKLHANYLSLAAQVPFIALGYRFKIYDFVKSVDLDQQLVAMDSESIMDELLSAHANITSDREEIITTMEKHRKMYAEKLREPMGSKGTVLLLPTLL